MTDRKLTALALVCSLKPSPARSSSELIADQVLAALRELGVHGESIRCVDYAIIPGVEADMGDGDQWPTIRSKVLDADIPAQGSKYWTGAAMESTDYNDLDEVPAAVASATAAAARNALHLANRLRDADYPAYQ